MQYSVDSTNGRDGSWIDCTGDSTAVNFAEGKVYVREKENTVNQRIVASITAPEEPPNASIGQGTLSGTVKLSDVSSGMEYKINEAAAWTKITGQSVDSLPVNIGDRIAVRKSATTDRLASDIQLIEAAYAHIKPAAAPAALQAKGTGNGTKLTNLTDGESYEYIIDQNPDILSTDSAWEQAAAVSLTGSTAIDNIPTGSGGKFIHIRKKASSAQPASEIKHVAASGQVLQLSFEGNTADSSIYNNNGTVENPARVAYVPGKVGQGIQFKGVDNRTWISVGNNISLQFGQEMTVAYWVRIDSYKGQDGNGRTVDKGIHAIFAKRHDKDGDLFSYLTTSSGNINLNVGEQGQSVSKPAEFTERNWVHVAQVISGNNMKMFINGERVSNENFAQSFNFTSANSEDLTIGRFGTDWYPIYGTLDDFQMHNIALTEAEIQSLYNPAQN